MAPNLKWLLHRAGRSAVVQRLAQRFRLPLSVVWRLGRADELEFWREYLDSRGGDWPDEFAARTDPSTPLEQRVTGLIDAPEGAEVVILDVGSGPLTCLGKRWDGREVRIVATDPLAADYDRLLARAGVEPLVRAIPLHAERLRERFPADHFDLVHARNSIDHCHDAPRAIRAMLAVARPGARVFLRHYVNEGEHAGYHGFHQWNLAVENGALIVWNKRTRFDATRELGEAAEVDARVTDDGWALATITKRGGS